MKNLLLLCFLVFSLSNCSNEPSKPSPDVEYDLENVRVLVPRQYQKIGSKKEVVEKLLGGTDSINFQNQLLLDRVFLLQKEDNHNFVKFENGQLSFITFRTNGDYEIMNDETEDYILGQYEASLEKNISPVDSIYRFKKIQSKLTGANRVRFLKYKYTHTEKDSKWYSTKYLITSGNRTIRMSIFSPISDYSDMENYMQFIQIK